MAIELTLPFPIVPDADGEPLEDGFVYIGTDGLNPQTSPISVYWDSALTIPAAQPVRTINGFLSRDGIPGHIFVAAAYSIVVRNKIGSLVYSSLSNTGYDGTLRAELADTTNGGGKGKNLVVYPITDSEAAAAVTPDDASYPPGHPYRYGGLADNATDSRAAIKAACAESAATGVPVPIEGPYFVDINDATDPIELTSGAHLVFTEKGSIRYDVFGLPCFYANEADGIRVENPHIIYDATVATSLPAMTTTFRDATLGLTATEILTRDVLSALLFVGCDNVTVTNPRFTNVTLSNTTVHPRCIVFSVHDDGSLATNNKVLGDIYIEAASQGILVWGQDGLTIDDIHQVNYGQVDSAVYTWEAAGHPIYVSSKAALANKNIRVGSIVDEGIGLAGYAVLAHTTFQFRNIVGLQHGPIKSKQSQGLGDYSAVTQAECGDLHWIGTTAADLVSAGAPLRFLAKDTGAPTNLEFTSFHLGKVYLNLADADTNAIVGSGADADFIKRLFIDDLTIAIDGTALSASTPLVTLSATDSRIKGTLIAPNAPASATFCRIDDGGTNNHVDLLVLEGPFATVRALNEQDKTNSTDNSFRVTDTNGSERVYSNHTAVETIHASEILTGVTGASVATAALIPAGGVLVSVTTIILTALGATGGTTGYLVGDGVDPDRWGALVGITKGSSTGGASWTNGTIEAFTSAQAITLTASGGNFDGTGDIRVGVAYTLAKADTNLQGY